MKIEKTVRQFVERRLDKGRPLLVALSGGPDSRALFELLKTFPIAAAHLDHGWREESAEEARQLERIVCEAGVPFHLKRLELGEGKSLEERGRQERLRFFAMLCREHGYQGVALGHHADDRAETVLKRVFEGAALPLAGTMQEYSDYRGVALYRPLISLTKREIGDYLERLGINAFDDSSNRNRRFLRARMREELFPFLEERFGKRVRPNLARLGEEAEQLSDYLKQQLKPYREKLARGKNSLFLDLTRQFPEHPYLLRQVVKMVEGEAGLGLSRQQLEAVCRLLEEGVGGKRVETARGILRVCGRRLDAEIKVC